MLTKESCKLFADMCAEIISEASTTGSLIASKPGGKELMQDLHKTAGAPHDLKYQEVPKISWSDLKDYSKQSWVLLAGPQGTGAIKADGNTYNAKASANGEITNFRNDRGGNILDFLKSKIGKISKIYVALQQKDTERIKRDRAERKKEPEAAKTSEESLTNKFKPLFARAINAAMADIRGFSATMIKNGNYNGAIKKMNLLSKYDEMLDRLESQGDLSDSMRRIVRDALILATAHYYPDEAGEVQTGSSRYGDRGGYSIANSQALQKLLGDISMGDTKKLSTVIGFFKQRLISP